MQLIDQAQLLTCLGMKSDVRENAEEKKINWEKSKQQLVEALKFKGEAMIKTGELDKEKFLGVYTENAEQTDDYQVKWEFWIFLYF